MLAGPFLICFSGIVGVFLLRWCWVRDWHMGAGVRCHLLQVRTELHHFFLHFFQPIKKIYWSTSGAVMANKSDFSFQHKINLARVKSRWHPDLKCINFCTANRTKQPETLLLLTNWSSIRCIVPEQYFIIDMNNSDRFLFWQKSAVEGVSSNASNLLQFVIHTTFHAMAFRHYNVYVMCEVKK